MITTLALGSRLQMNKFDWNYFIGIIFVEINVYCWVKIINLNCNKITKKCIISFFGFCSLIGLELTLSV